jgi:hypothetical protein
MAQGETKVAKPACSSSNAINNPRRDNGISAVRVKIFLKYADSSSEIQEDPLGIWIVQLAKWFASTARAVEISHTPADNCPVVAESNLDARRDSDVVSIP